MQAAVDITESHTVWLNNSLTTLTTSWNLRIFRPVLQHIFSFEYLRSIPTRAMSRVVLGSDEPDYDAGDETPSLVTVAHLEQPKTSTPGRR